MHTAPLTLAPSGADPASRETRLRAAATRLEATFLKEMLAAAGLDRAAPGLSGGAGEEQFSSFLLEAQAQRLAEGGGIGLAESLYKALKARDGA